MLECTPEAEDGHQYHSKAHGKQSSHCQYLLSPQSWPKVLRERNQEDDDIKEHVRACKDEQSHLRLIHRSVTKAGALGVGGSMPAAGHRQAREPGKEGERKTPPYHNRQ